MPETTMTPAEREAFLAEPQVAVISIPATGRGPLSVPVWYYLAPNGDVCIWTGRESHKGRLLSEANRISVCIQDPKPPYRYASAEGPFTIEPVNFERDVRPMALRYYGPVEGEKFLSSIGGAKGVATDILVRLHPQRWLTVDYSKVEPPAG